MGEFTAAPYCPKGHAHARPKPRPSRAEGPRPSWRARRAAPTAAEGRCLRARRARLNLQLLDLPRERIAMHAEGVGCLAEIALGLVDDAGEELLVELPACIPVMHAATHHLAH